METTPEVLITEAMAGKCLADRDTILEVCGRITSPTLVIHGDDDQVSPVSRGRRSPPSPAASSCASRGRPSADGPHPVAVNLHIERFVDHVARQVAA